MSNYKKYSIHLKHAEESCLLKVAFLAYSIPIDRLPIYKLLGKLGVENKTTVNYVLQSFHLEISAIF